MEDGSSSRTSPSTGQKLTLSSYLAWQTVQYFMKTYSGTTCGFAACDYATLRAKSEAGVDKSNTVIITAWSQRAVDQFDISSQCKADVFGTAGALARRACVSTL